MSILVNFVGDGTDLLVIPRGANRYDQAMRSKTYFSVRALLEELGIRHAFLVSKCLLDHTDTDGAKCGC